MSGALRGSMIKRRLVFPIAGYDPVDAVRHHRRFARGLVTFARTWNVNAEVSNLAEATPDKPAHWTVTTCGGNWRVEATYVPLAWNDIVLADLSRPMPLRLARFGAALFDFIRTGTSFRYFRANWKYGFFFFYPAFHLVVFAAIGAVLGLWAANLAQLEGAASALTATAVGAAAFCGLLSWLGRRWRVIQALDDWIFAYDYLHGRRPDVELWLDRFAREIAAAAREDRYDEIVVVGHSLGATLAVNVVARALERDPALGRHGTPVCVLTVGSTIPKFTLHPDAVRIRLDVARLAADANVEWAEYHARADPISFYMFDPAGGRIKRDRFDRKPVIRLVRIKNMVAEGGYRRIQFKFMRVHHQFVMANERRTTYDFYMMGCGPIPFMRSVMERDGPAALIGPAGELVEPVQAVAAPVAATA
jgi:pimeloyl-ACP methyl ester carboxylesterase